MQRATRDDLREINELIQRALSDDDPAQAGFAAIDAFVKMRKHGLGIECIADTEQDATEPLAPTPGDSLPNAPSSETDPRLINSANFVMPFGKHRGEKLDETLTSDDKYFWWLENKATITNSNLAEAVEDLWERRAEFGIR